VSDKENSENENPRDKNDKNKNKKEKSKNEKISDKDKKPQKTKNTRQIFDEEVDVRRQPRLIKGRTVQFKLKKSDGWRTGWIADVEEKKVCIRYHVDKNKVGKYEDVWIDKNSDKIEVFSRNEHKRNLDDTMGAFEKLNI